MILYAYHTYLPGKKGEQQKIDEQVEFSYKISEKKIITATYVIDLVKNKMIKNRYRYDKENPVKDEQAINYFLEEYHKEIVEFIKNGR